MCGGCDLDKEHFQFSIQHMVEDDQSEVGGPLWLRQYQHSVLRDDVLLQPWVQFAVQGHIRSLQCFGCLE